MGMDEIYNVYFNVSNAMVIRLIEVLADRVLGILKVNTRKRFLLTKTSGPDGDVGLLKL